MKTFDALETTSSTFFIIAKISKPNTKSASVMSNDGSLLLFDMQKINISERFIRRTFNLCHSNMQSRQKLTTFSDENFTTTFVKIGLEYQAITNDYSLS